MMRRYPYPLGQPPATEPRGGALTAETFGSGQLCSTMMLRGAVGVVIGAAAAPAGKEGLWASVGFAMGATVGEVGIVGVALAALWRKAS